MRNSTQRYQLLNLFNLLERQASNIIISITYRLLKLVRISSVSWLKKTSKSINGKAQCERQSVSIRLKIVLYLFVTQPFASINNVFIVGVYKKCFSKWEKPAQHVAHRTSLNMGPMFLISFNRIILVTSKAY